MGAFAQIREAMVFAFVPPAVIELGTSGGFTVQMQDRSGLGHEALLAARNQFLGMAAQDKRLVGVRPNGQEDMPELKLDIDHAKAGALGLSIADINDTLSTAWGGSYINDFLDRGRIKKVYLQGDAPARMTPEDLDKWYVRNKAGDMVPFSAFATAHWTYGSPRLERFNGQPSMEILGQSAPGLSSGEAMQAVEEIMAKMPPGIGYDWSGTSLRGAPLRLAGAGAVRAVAAGGVPVPGGAVRELVGALRGDAGGAARRARRAARRHRARACRTTCTSRSACSPPSACRRRTRS